MVVLLIVGLLVWFLLLAPRQTLVSVDQGSTSLGTSNTQSSGVSQTLPTDTTNQTTPIGNISTQRVFKIADGPVTGATFTQTFNPTTTLARYVLQENGHVMDQPIDIPGSLSRAVSNTTIPGTASVVWGGRGSVAYMQYFDGGVVKTVSLKFPDAATSSRSVTKPVEIQFLPDNVVSLAVSPSGAQVAYLLANGSTGDGYVANIDGGNAKKLFSIGFSQLLLSWPSANTLLLITKSAAGTPGMAFSADVKTGNILPLIYAEGLSAVADALFKNVLYRAESGGTPASYLHSMQNNTDIPLSFSPIPEKCAWGNLATTTVYCGSPIKYTDASYLDQWHLGAASAADAIISFVPSLNAKTNAVAVPGSADGGVQSDILEMAVSPDDKYLLFITKGDRSLWGVRLGQN